MFVTIVRGPDAHRPKTRSRIGSTKNTPTGAPPLLLRHVPRPAPPPPLRCPCSPAGRGAHLVAPVVHAGGASCATTAAAREHTRTHQRTRTHGIVGGACARRRNHAPCCAYSCATAAPHPSASCATHPRPRVHAPATGGGQPGTCRRGDAHRVERQRRCGNTACAQLSAQSAHFGR